MTVRRSSRSVASLLGGCAFLSAVAAWADTPQKSPPPPPPPAVPAPPASQPSSPLPQPPLPSLQHLEEGQHFQIDPVTDGVLILGGAGLAGLLSLVLNTGEIQATAPGPISNLLSIDRGAVTQSVDPNANTWSDVVLWASIGYAVADPILSGFRDGWDAGLVDGVMYAETLALTEMLTDITKIAVRRPRPIDYLNCPVQTTTTAAVSPACAGTNNDLSFFSGHAATVSAIGATATYLAFERSPWSLRAWLTLSGAVVMTTLVSYWRVRGGDHFPTDVIAGSMAGAAIGILVPHLHRHVEEAPPVLVGAAPTSGGAMVALTARF
jgi:undecaprenyl-diphosphatase